jgi:hypothetical protein
MLLTDVGEICRELNLQEAAAVAGADLVTGFHHVVWMGDLNYRLEYGQQVCVCVFVWCVCVFARLRASARL